MRLIVGGLFVAAALVVCGCASIPISTAVQLSSLSPSSLAQTEPSQVRVKLAVPEGYELDIANTRLKLALTGPSGASSGEMGLSSLGTLRESRSAGVFSSNVSVLTYSLALTPDGIHELKQLQRFMVANKPDKFNFSVKGPLSKAPPGAREVTFWVDLKLSPDESFMPLIKGAKITFEESGTSN